MYRHVSHVSAIEKSDLDQVFWAIHTLSRDEVHHSVWCWLDVPHLARVSRLCRGRPRPCSRCLPATGSVFVFLSKCPSVYFRFFVKMSKRLFLRLLGTSYIPITVYVYKKHIGVAGRLQSVQPEGQWFESRMALFFCVPKFHFFLLAPCILWSVY